MNQDYVREDEIELSEDELQHYGILRRSGRYPYGSGKNPFQHSGDFLSRIDELHKSGMSEKEIADSMGLTTSQLRIQKSLANGERRGLEVERARSLREHGYSLNEIAEKMGYANDSSIRSLLNEHSEARMNQARTTADFLKKAVDEKGMIDVGAGVESELGISREKLKEALYILELEGYPNYKGGVPQVTNPGKQINRAVLCPPGTEHKEIYDFENVHSLTDYDKILCEDGTKVRNAFEYPASMDSKRLTIKYGDEGGAAKDGLIELRRGVEDLSLGDAHYAQVRILVDGTHYIKGMAVYADDLPDGVDVRFNTNKKSGTPMISKDGGKEVLKPIGDDPDNPFGSLIKERGGQSYYDDPNGKFTDPVTGNKQSLSLINKRAEEGDWGNWSNTLASQFLGKQSVPLIKRQLKLAEDDKVAEFEEIKALTNPTVKKAMLNSFADDCDAAAVHLKAAALPRQKYQVLIPLEKIKDDEVYAPNYRDGETVALVRYPHGGTFEIPILTVNNKIREGANVIGKTPKDAIGINAKVAERLSGADFDGDTVMVIPTSTKASIKNGEDKTVGVGSKPRIISTEPLKGLKDFDPKMEYPERKGMKYMKNTQTEMGIVSNLITDMTLKGAREDEIARAVKHSMVVIDAEKHKLDYKLSEQQNGISALKKKYQGSYDEDGQYHEGASTLLSRASSQQSVLKRQGSPRVNQIGKDWYDPSKPEGALIYKTADDLTYVNKKGKTVVRTQRSTKMAETDDAFKLVSEADNPREVAYANYANKMKSLANEARKEALYAGKIEYSSTAKETYKNEVESLNAKLRLAEKNAPKERLAQNMANVIVEAKKKAYPDLKKSEIKKISQQALTASRKKVGAERQSINITDKEWEAIQSGAISENRLTKIINHTDKDALRQRATPRSMSQLSDAKIAKIKAMKESENYTTLEIAQAVGVSASTVGKYM